MNDYCACGHRPATDRHMCGITFVAQEKRIRELESALQLIGNELSLHADQGPAGEAFRALLNPTFDFDLAESETRSPEPKE